MTLLIDEIGILINEILKIRNKIQHRCEIKYPKYNMKNYIFCIPENHQNRIYIKPVIRKNCNIYGIGKLVDLNNIFYNLTDVDDMILKSLFKKQNNLYIKIKELKYRLDLEKVKGLSDDIINIIMCYADKTETLTNFI